MPGPTLTDAEKAQCKKEAAKATSAAATFTSQIAAQTARAAELAVVDGAYKKFYDYYNGIITAYDLERKQIDGQYIAAPIIEQDILDCANGAGRVVPSLPVIDVVRISQFDGTPLITNPTYELLAITKQADAEDVLVHGYGSGTYAMTTMTATSLTPTSTTLQLTDASATFTIAPGTVFIVSTLTDFAVVVVDTFVPVTSPVPPPYVANLTIHYLIPPTGTIPAGQQLTAFTGFTNAERTTKTSTDPKLQGLMNYLITKLDAQITARIPFLDAQTSAIGTNQDPDGTAQNANALTNIATSKSFLNTYIITTDISDTGLAGLSSERSTRTTNANARITQIISAYTGRTQNYYNQRYSYANNRANTARGSLRLQQAAASGAATSASYASTLGDQASSLTTLIS
jgi:hypothetical protein